MTWRMNPRVAEQRRSRWWLGAGLMVAATAAVVFFLDPEQGRGRRIRVVERAEHMGRIARRRTGRRLAYARHTIQARIAQLTGATPPEPLEGRELLDRVESELFADRSIPHGRLTLEAEGTTVVVRGEVEGADDMAKIEAAILEVPGVSAVRSLMHTPGTPAPNKIDALIASDHAEAEERRTRRSR